MSMLITYIIVLRENLSSSVPFGKTYLSSTAIHGFIMYWDFLSRKLDVSLLERKDKQEKCMPISARLLRNVTRM